MKTFTDNAPVSGVLNQAFDRAKSAMVVVSADDMKVIQANKAIHQLLGYAPQQLLGKNLADIECSLQDLFFWDDLKISPINDGFRLVESEWQTQSGEIIPVEKYVTSCIEDGRSFFVLNIENISSRKQTIENQIRLSSQLQSSLEATAEGIISIDLNGRSITSIDALLICGNWIAALSCRIACNR